MHRVCYPPHEGENDSHSYTTFGSSLLWCAHRPLAASYRNLSGSFHVRGRPFSTPASNISFGPSPSRTVFHKRVRTSSIKSRSALNSARVMTGPYDGAILVWSLLNLR